MYLCHTRKHKDFVQFLVIFYIEICFTYKTIISLIILFVTSSCGHFCFKILDVDTFLLFQIPGTNICPKDWKVEYQGHLVSHPWNTQATEFICLDNDVENHSDESHFDNDNTIIFVEARCNSLPCPPYAKKVLLCVVCSQK